MDKLTFLIVEDDELSRYAIKKELSYYGSVDEVTTADEAIALLEKKHYNMVLIDLNLEVELSGCRVIQKSNRLGLYSVVLTACAEDFFVERCYGFGCNDYFLKDGSTSKLHHIVKKYMRRHKGHEVIQDFLNNKFITEDPETVKMIEDCFQDLSEQPLLIQGESGVGKSLLAYELHKMTKGEGMPFVYVNCSEFSPTLLESELFGHVKGAFTGALKDKKGRLELAHGGTLFLDEIATMPLNLQVKLLHALEDKRFIPVGSEKPVQASFRIISATWQNLEKMTSQGEFRFDLYSRINAKKIVIKPIRERRADIELMIKRLLKKGRCVVIRDNAMDVLLNYSWPGNVRELKHVIDQITGIENGVVDYIHLPKKIKDDYDNRVSMAASSGGLIDDRHIGFIKKYGIKKFIYRIKAESRDVFIKKNHNNHSAAIREMKISRTAFYSKELGPMGEGSNMFIE